jgi:hypothetical protein
MAANSVQFFGAPPAGLKRRILPEMRALLTIGRSVLNAERSSHASLIYRCAAELPEIRIAPERVKGGLQVMDSYPEEQKGPTANSSETRITILDAARRSLSNVAHRTAKKPNPPNGSKMFARQGNFCATGSAILTSWSGAPRSGQFATVSTSRFASPRFAILLGVMNVAASKH